jgi:hypothetical protein
LDRSIEGKTFDRSIEGKTSSARCPVYNLVEKLGLWAAGQTKDLINRDNFVYAASSRRGV